MTEVVTIHKAKTELSKLIKRVEAGEEIVIARGNKQVARIVSVASQLLPQKRRTPGGLEHLLGKIPDTAFFAPLPNDELKLWEGKD